MNEEVVKDKTVPVFDTLPGKPYLRVISDCAGVGGRATLAHVTRGEAQLIVEDYLSTLAYLDGFTDSP